jgi:aromatic-L-amino-acid decarboxylase
VDAAPGWERLAPVPFQTVVLRHVPAGLAEPSPGAPAGLDEAALTAHNLAIAAAVNASGKAYVTPSVLKGRQTLRVSCGSASTERRHVEAVWGALRAAAGAAQPASSQPHRP